jgi:hypothetical protein
MTETVFWATVAQVRTLADGGIRVTMDLPEDAIMQAAQLMECKRVGVVLKVTVNIDSKSDKSRKIQI